jgi:hypothetical protein
MAACNSWNANNAATKAWLAVDDLNSSADGGLVLESVLPLDGRTKQVTFDGFLDDVTRSAAQFWRTLGARSAPTEGPGKRTS